jgi:hypothetical protein
MNTAGMQEHVAEEVNTRLAKATQELQAKYAAGKGGDETSLSGPTGKAYQEKQAHELAAKKLKNEQRRQQNVQVEENEGDQEYQDDDEDEDNDDPELERIRNQRKKQLLAAHNTKIENIGKGHGQFREISQDEFLNEVTSSLKVVCHFYHNDFGKCEIMNHHLAKLAPQHIECKFIKMNAEKAPFFVEKVRNSSLSSFAVLLSIYCLFFFPSASLSFAVSRCFFGASFLEFRFWLFPP